MVNYCERTEKDGYIKLLGMLAKYGGYSWMPGVLQNNINEWTKRGARKDSQISYGVGQGIDAFLDLQYMATHGAGIKQGAANDCLEQWSVGSIKWTLVEYCYKRAVGLD
jgi:hypothetical protein